MNDTVIPVMTCFDDRYAIPAAVAFRSLLEHADPNLSYRLHVLHSDISPEHQAGLRETVAPFQNAELVFTDMQGAYADAFAALKTKGHYSKEFIYKIVASRLFPQYERLIITDVDCVFEGDVAQPFLRFRDDRENYFAGVLMNGAAPCRWLGRVYDEDYGDDFSPDELAVLKRGFNAGFFICNLDLMRRDGLPERTLAFFKANAHRIKQPEQDSLHLCCHPKIAELPPGTMRCSYLNDCLEADERAAWEPAFRDPLQIHYVTKQKPWNVPSVAWSEKWYGYLSRTPFWREQMLTLDRVRRKSVWKLFGFLPLVRVWSDAPVTAVSLLKTFKLRMKG